MCNADADYADATLVNQTALTNMGAFVGFGDLNADAAPDALLVQMFPGFGVFQGGVVTGTFTIAGDELNFATCGLCVRVMTDFDGMDFSDDGYLATGGTVDVTSIAGNLTFTASNLTFEHVTIDEMTAQSTPHPDMCMSAMTSVSFDQTIQ